MAIVAIALVWGLILCTCTHSFLSDLQLSITDMTGCKRTCKRNSARSMEPALTGQRGARLSSWDGSRPPVVPFASRPPIQPPLMATARRASVPPTLPPVIVETRNVPPSGRNQSWDSAYGQPTAGSARRGNRGSGGSGVGSRAREPAFPPSLNSAQTRPRADRSNWVDPTKWNGPS